MSAPYMPLFVADYLADTAHLSAAEHGAYLLLIMNYWQREKPLPADDRKLARIARMTDVEWSDAKLNLSEFFEEQDGEWRHARIDQELSVAQQKSAKAKASARASVAARQANAERTLNDRSADVELLGEDREGKKDSPESKSSTTNVRSVGKPTRPAADEKFEEFWKAYPHRGEASDPKKPAREKFDRAVKRGADPEAIIAGAKRFAEIELRAGRAGTEKCAQAVTWLNQDRWHDYQPAPSDQQPASVFVARGSEEWDAWARHRGKEPLSKFYPEHRAEGWYFPTLLPPSIEKAA
ncbi:Uncharacterized conserved protein YdaU, DUF1376 family [Bosea thiooxidans]|uniref:Uncharacterized conserved protein YdaU, DUF1376 family n=1 Tax=Bosea thiooxidans TaxID=53254 RepID=A0A1T5FLT5_9HYPH|nr:DUF1376 domain-containing protein [Bosea thiooxidans]SKB97140.1 Uncharacterized conserved protein YdaU, DUF1376 family [Bosea thiooxidans]